MDKVFKFVKGGWALVAALCIGYVLYLLVIGGPQQDIFFALIFAAFAGVMYYLNVRRVKMYEEKSGKKRK